MEGRSQTRKYKWEKRGAEGVNRVSNDFFENLSPVSTVCPSATVVLVVPVSSSVLGRFGEDILFDTDCEFVESQIVSLSKRRHASFVESQEEMNISDRRKCLQHLGKRFVGSNTE